MAAAKRNGSQLLRRVLASFTSEYRTNGIRYDQSILQAECTLTQVFDRPVTSRILFEEMIREELVSGQADHVPLNFGRRIRRRIDSRFRTRVINDGVLPSVHLDCRRWLVKQYFNEGRALRTETVINNMHHFGVKRKEHNVNDLKKVGSEGNRRLRDVQRTSHDCPIEEVKVFEALHRTDLVDSRRVSAMRFGEPRLQVVLSALVMYAYMSASSATASRGRRSRSSVRQTAPAPARRPAACSGCACGA